MRVGRCREGFGDEVLEELGEFLDLAEFIGHAVAGLAAVVEDAERFEPGGIGGDEVVLRLVVRGGGSGGRGRGGDGFEAEPGGSVGLGFELGGLCGGEEVGVEKIETEERFDFGEGGGGRVILGDVASGMAGDEGEVRAGLERDGADENILERGVGARRGRFTEREFHEGAIGEGGAEDSEEAFAGGRLGHCGE